MYKFSYIWLFWLILIFISVQISRSDKLRSGMIFIYDAIDTSLWEVNLATLEAELWLDFDAPLVSIYPVSFRVDRQSLVYIQVPPRDEYGIPPYEYVELDLKTGIELTLMETEIGSYYSLPAPDLRLLTQFTEDGEPSYCFFSLQTGFCEPSSQEQSDFLIDGRIIWEDPSGYFLKEKALYHFDAETLSWELVLNNAWFEASSAAMDTQTNSIYIAGYLNPPNSGCGASPMQLMRLDLSSLEIELLPFTLPDCLSQFDRMLVSPDGRYLQYDTQEVVVIDLQTGELVYRPFWYSDRAMWMSDSQSLLFTYYEQPGTSGNRISHVNILTGNINLIYEGNAGHVWLYQVP